MIAHLRYRKLIKTGVLPQGSFKAPLSPVGDWFVLAFLALVTVLLAFNSSNRIALYVAPFVLAGIAMGTAFHESTRSGSLQLRRSRRTAPPLGRRRWPSPRCSPTRSSLPPSGGRGPGQGARVTNDPSYVCH